MLLSIITITYNAEQFLERTIKSIITQTDKDFEYIIIDGKSKDGTLKIVEKYKSYITQLISEPDKGLYDAMNKGLKMATGDFVWFMNAGDEITDNQTVSEIKKLVNEDTAIFYGETNFLNNAGEFLGIRSDLTPHKLPKTLSWKDLRYGMLVCHQSFIVRRSIAPFFIENNLSADVDWEIECLKRAKKIVYLDFIISNYLIGGISNQQLKRSLIDRYKVLEKHFGFFGAIHSHIIILFRGVIKILKKGGKYW